MDLAAQKFMVLLDWCDGVLCPGPDFDLKKMSSVNLRSLVEGYIEDELHGTKKHTTFSIGKWSDGMYLNCSAPTLS